MYEAGSEVKVLLYLRRWIPERGHEDVNGLRHWETGPLDETQMIAKRHLVYHTTTTIPTIPSVVVGEEESFQQCRLSYGPGGGWSRKLSPVRLQMLVLYVLT